MAQPGRVAEELEEEEDAGASGTSAKNIKSNVKWTAEMVMVIVRDFDQDKETLAKNLKEQFKLGKISNGTVEQYTRRLKKWSLDLFQADLKLQTEGLARSDTEAQDRSWTRSQVAAYENYKEVLASEFTRMKFSRSEQGEIINLGGMINAVEKGKERKSRARGTQSGFGSTTDRPSGRNDQNASYSNATTEGYYICGSRSICRRR